MMTTITLELPEQIVSRVEQRAAARGLTLSQQVSELLDESLQENQDRVRDEAIRRMNELFARVSGFRGEPHISREELYERERLR